MAKRRGGFWLYAVVGLMLGACGGDDSSPAGSGGSSAAGGAGGAGGAAASGGAGGSTSGGTAGTGGESGAAGSGGSGGTTGSPDAGSGSDATSDAPGTVEGGEAGRCLPAGTMTVVNDGSSGYLFDGGPLNPVLTLCRGNKYTFVIDAPGHPIYVRQQSGTTFLNGITGNHIESGNLVFDVPRDAPAMLFYQCDIHDVMTGAIVIVD